MGVPLPFIAGVHVFVFSSVCTAVSGWTWSSAGGVLRSLILLIRVLAWPEAAGPAKLFNGGVDVVEGFIMDQAWILSLIDGLVRILVHAIDTLRIHFAPVNGFGCLIGAVGRLGIPVRELCVCFRFRASAPKTALPAPPLLAFLARGQKWLPSFCALYN
jgi:hypothetical protein